MTRWILCLLLLLPTLARAQYLDTGQLEDAGLEQRAVDLGRTLRCVVCANQSIEDSEVELAVTLRKRVRDRLLAGADEGQIRDELIASYGQYVSYSPTTSGWGWMLWASPWLALLLGGSALVLARRGKGTGQGHEAAHD